MLWQLKTSPKIMKPITTAREFDRLRARIECQQPTEDLYQFIGTFTAYATSAGEVKNKTHLGLENLLPRGARLKDTQFIYGQL